MIRAFVDAPCPLAGYDDLSVRVCASVTDREWRNWATGNLGLPDCVDCATLRQAQTDGSPRVYCDACTTKRQAFAQSIVLFYGPRLLDHDVTTPDQALALFDSDDLLPSEIVTWLIIAPRIVRDQRQKDLLGNLDGS